jgi:FtsZ-interacting cell division protein ZipA
MKSILIIFGAIAVIGILRYLSIYSEKMKAGASTNFINKKEPEDQTENTEKITTEK